MPNLNMNNFQTRNRTFDPDPLPYNGPTFGAVTIGPVRASQGRLS